MTLRTLGLVVLVLSGCSAPEDGPVVGDAGVDATFFDASNDSSVGLDATPFDPCANGGVTVDLQFRPEFSNWYFGDRAGLRFSAGASPTPLTDGALETYEGVATYSDQDGVLLMYTDGSTIWNREHDAMPNGTRLGGDSSSTQSGVIVPMPGSTTRYYVFSTDAVGGANGTRYSVVDMTLEGGLGAVVEGARSVPLHGPTAEKLVAVRHRNESDFWIVTHDLDSNCFRAWQLTSGGIDVDAAVVSCAGATVSSAMETITETQGQMKVNRWGDLLAVAHYGNPVGLRQVELLDFDASTGRVSNARTLMTDIAAYGLEFSPAGTRLYGTSGPERHLYQWDLCAEDIAASRVTVAAIDVETTGIVTVGALQLGPDGLIYIAAPAANADGDFSLSVIRRPDELGAAVGYEFRAIGTGGRSSRYGLPNFIQFFPKVEDVLL